MISVYSINLSHRRKLQLKILFQNLSKQTITPLEKLIIEPIPFEILYCLFQSPILTYSFKCFLIYYFICSENSFYPFWMFYISKDCTFFKSHFARQRLDVINSHWPHWPHTLVSIAGNTNGVCRPTITFVNKCRRVFIIHCRNKS